MQFGDRFNSPPPAPLTINRNPIETTTNQDDNDPQPQPPSPPPAITKTPPFDDENILEPLAEYSMMPPPPPPMPMGMTRAQTLPTMRREISSDSKRRLVGQFARPHHHHFPPPPRLVDADDEDERSRRGGGGFYQQQQSRHQHRFPSSTRRFQRPSSALQAFGSSRGGGGSYSSRPSRAFRSNEKLPTDEDRDPIAEAVSATTPSRGSSNKNSRRSGGGGGSNPNKRHRDFSSYSNAHLYSQLEANREKMHALSQNRDMLQRMVVQVKNEVSYHSLQLENVKKALSEEQMRRDRVAEEMKSISRDLDDAAAVRRRAVGRDDEHDEDEERAIDDDEAEADRIGEEKRLYEVEEMIARTDAMQSEIDFKSGLMEVMNKSMEVQQRRMEEEMLKQEKRRSDATELYKNYEFTKTLLTEKVNELKEEVDEIRHERALLLSSQPQPSHLSQSQQPSQQRPSQQLQIERNENGKTSGGRRRGNGKEGFRWVESGDNPHESESKGSVDDGVVAGASARVTEDKNHNRSGRMSEEEAHRAKLKRHQRVKRAKRLGLYRPPSSSSSSSLVNADGDDHDENVRDESATTEKGYPNMEVINQLICAQCEFYFSDYNLKRDKHLLEMIMADERPNNHDAAVMDTSESSSNNNNNKRKSKKKRKKKKNGDIDDDDVVDGVFENGVNEEEGKRNDNRLCLGPCGFIPVSEALVLNKLKQFCVDETHLIDAIETQSKFLKIIDDRWIGRPHFLPPREKSYPFRRTVFLYGMPLSADKNWVKAMCEPFGKIEKVQFDHGPDTLDRIIMRQMLGFGGENENENLVVGDDEDKKDDAEQHDDGKIGDEENMAAATEENREDDDEQDKKGNNNGNSNSSGKRWLIGRTTKVYSLLSKQTNGFTLEFARSFENMMPPPPPPANLVVGASPPRPRPPNVTPDGKFKCSWCGSKNNHFADGFYMRRGSYRVMVCIQCAAKRAMEQCMMYENGLKASGGHSLELAALLLGRSPRDVEDMKTCLVVFASQRQASKCVFIRSRLSHDGCFATHFHHYSKLKKNIVFELTRNRNALALYDVNLIGKLTGEPKKEIDALAARLVKKKGNKALKSRASKRRLSPKKHGNSGAGSGSSSNSGFGSPGVRRTKSAEDSVEVKEDDERTGVEVRRNAAATEGTTTDESGLLPSVLRMNSAPDFSSDGAIAHLTTGLHDIQEAKNEDDDSI